MAPLSPKPTYLKTHVASEKAEDMCLFGREAGGVRGSLLRQSAACV